MKKAIPFLIIGIFLFLQGCSSAAGKRYFQLHISAPAQPGPDVSLPGRVLVRLPHVDMIYNGARLVYRLSPFQLNYYNYEYWVKTPSRMIRDALVTYLETRRKFDQVITESDGSEPDWIVSSELHAMEEYDHKGTWHAHLSMTLSIRKNAKDGIVVSHRFDRLDQLAKKDLRLLPLVISETLRSELDKMFRKLDSLLAP